MQDASLLCLYFSRGWEKEGRGTPLYGYVGMSGPQGYGFDLFWHWGICVLGCFLLHQHSQVSTVTFENVCRVQKIRQVLIKMCKFNMFITAV